MAKLGKLETLGTLSGGFGASMSQVSPSFQKVALLADMLVGPAFADSAAGVGRGRPLDARRSLP